MMQKISIIVLVLISLSANISAFAENMVFSVGLGGVQLSKQVKSTKEIREENVVRQRMDISCGPASLATILTYHFQDKTNEQEIIKYLLSANGLEETRKKGGFSLLDLKRFAQSKDYEATGYKMEPQYLNTLNKPTIVLLNIREYPHFMVLKGVRGNRAYLADPAWGNTTMRLSDFSDLWQGMLLVVGSKTKEPSNLLAVKPEDLIVPDPSDIKANLRAGLLHFVANPSEF